MAVGLAAGQVPPQSGSQRHGHRLSVWQPVRLHAFARAPDSQAGVIWHRCKARSNFADTRGQQCDGPGDPLLCAARCHRAGGRSRLLPALWQTEAGGCQDHWRTQAGGWPRLGSPGTLDGGAQATPFLHAVGLPQPDRYGHLAGQGFSGVETGARARCHDRRKRRPGRLQTLVHPAPGRIGPVGKNDLHRLVFQVIFCIAARGLHRLQ